jgi:hypothetical protein
MFFENIGNVSMNQGIPWSHTEGSFITMQMVKYLDIDSIIGGPTNSFLGRLLEKFADTNSEQLYLDHNTL